MFPMVEEQFNFDELDKLGAEIEAEKKKFQSANKIKPESREKARGPIGRLVQAVTGVFTDERDKEAPKTRRSTAKKPRTISASGAKAPGKKGNGKAAASRTRAKATSKTSKPASKKRGATKSKTTAKPAKKRSTKSPSRSTKKPAGKSARAGR